MGITHLQLNELTDHKESTLLRLVDERIEIINQESSIVRKFEQKKLLPKGDNTKHAAIIMNYLFLVTIKEYLTKDKEEYEKLLGKEVYEIIYFIFFDYVASLIIDFSKTKIVIRKRYLPSSKTNIKEDILHSITNYHFRLGGSENLLEIANLDNITDLSFNSHKFYLLLRLNFLFLFYDEPLIDEFLEGEYFFESNEMQGMALGLAEADWEDLDMMYSNYQLKVLDTLGKKYFEQGKILNNLIKNNTTENELSLFQLSTTISDFRNVLGISRKKLVDEMATYGSKYTSATWLIRLEEANFKKNEDDKIISQTIDKLAASFISIAENIPYPSRYDHLRLGSKYRIAHLFIHSEIAYEGLIYPAYTKLKEAQDPDLNYAFANAIKVYEDKIGTDISNYMPSLIHFCLQKKNKIKRRVKDMEQSSIWRNYDLDLKYNEDHFILRKFKESGKRKDSQGNWIKKDKFPFPTITYETDDHKTVNLTRHDGDIPLEIDSNFFADGIIDKIDETGKDITIMPAFIKVKDDSMSPEINKGDVAIYLKTKISEDDSLVFNFGDLYVLKNKDIRRIVKPGDLKPDFVIIKATNEEKWPSAELPIEDLFGIAGKVIGIIKSV